MNAFLTDDKQWIVIDADDAEKMTVQEFVDCYGEDAIPIECSSCKSGDESMRYVDQIRQYYLAFRRVCVACGWYAWSRNTALNADEGVYPVIQMLQEKYGQNVESKLSHNVERYNKSQRMAVDRLAYWTVQVCGRRITEEDKNVLLRHLYNPYFRRRMYYRIDKYLKNGLLFLPDELVIDVLESLRKSGIHYVIKAPV